MIGRRSTPRWNAPKTRNIGDGERVSFAAAYDGERVLANILLPKNVRPPYQAVVWFPG